MFPHAAAAPLPLMELAQAEEVWNQRQVSDRLSHVADSHPAQIVDRPVPPAGSLAAAKAWAVA
jgi:hypothetical protein